MKWKDVERNMSQGIYVRAVITTDEVQNTKYITLLNLPYRKV